MAHGANKQATPGMRPGPIPPHISLPQPNGTGKPAAAGRNHVASTGGHDGAKPTKGAGFGPMYSFMRFVGERSAAHFFRRVLVVGGDDVPRKGPFILCCTHFSTLMDVALISAELPHRRPIHYWAKRGLYKRQPFRWILENSGNIQVDRREKNNEALFSGTFEAMKAGEAIGLFPEGGSYTEHRLHSMKAGAAWAALEYAKHLHNLGDDAPLSARTPVLIVPAAINYTDKSRFRSEALFEFGKAFSVDDFTAEFLRSESVETITSAVAQNLLAHAPPTPGPSVIIGDGPSGPHPPSRMQLGLDVGNTSADESAATLSQASVGGMLSQRTSKVSSDTSAARAAVRRLTDRIGAEIYKMTIDAPDWTTWHAIKMARELIWRRGGTIPLQNLVPISNALVAVLTAPIQQAREANEALCALQGLLLASSTDVYTLNVVAKRAPVSRRVAAVTSNATVDEPFRVPSRRQARAALPNVAVTTALLLRALLALAIRLPYVAPLAAVYAPAYFVGWALSLRYASHEEESMASAKSLCAFVIAGLTHVGLIVFVAALLLFTPPGWLLGLAVSFLIEKTHVWLLDESYNCVKNLVIAWRLSLAVAGSSASTMLPNALASRFATQLGAEDTAVLTAVDIVKTHQGVQWSFIKALRGARAERNPRKQAMHLNAPNRAQPLRRLVERPACFRMMGATRAVHARAERALAALLVEIERIDVAAVSSHQNGAPQLPQATLDKYRYLRNEMQSSNASLLPRRS